MESASPKWSSLNMPLYNGTNPYRSTILSVALEDMEAPD
jgi:hypothetical protein